jgi:hypothetical protein
MIRQPAQALYLRLSKPGALVAASGVRGAALYRSDLAAQGSGARLSDHRHFCKDDAAGLRAVNREFVLLVRELKLLGGDLVAIDDAFFHGDASKASILTEKRPEHQMAAVDRMSTTKRRTWPRRRATGCGRGDGTEAGDPAPAAGGGSRSGPAARQRRGSAVAYRSGCAAALEARADQRLKRQGRFRPGGLPLRMRNTPLKLGAGRTAIQVSRGIAALRCILLALFRLAAGIGRGAGLTFPLAPTGLVSPH